MSLSIALEKLLLTTRQSIGFTLSVKALSTIERNRFSLLYVVIFFLFNYIFAVIGSLIFNLSLPNILSIWWKAATDAQFQMSLITHLLIFMIPFYLISFWFYGPQAKRMAAKMFSSQD